MLLTKSHAVMTKDPTALSWALREGQTPDLNRRRQVVGLSLVAAAAMGVVSLYQMGLVRKPPEPPLRHFDAAKVSGSAQGYAVLEMPDAPLALMSYATTLTLAAMGGADRARRLPLVPLALAGKVVVDALVSAKLSADQATRYKAACLWCLSASAATFAMVPLVIPEAREAWRNLRRPPAAPRITRAAKDAQVRDLAATR
jgi:uncharacterized membrane protein